MMKMENHLFSQHIRNSIVFYDARSNETIAHLYLIYHRVQRHEFHLFHCCFLSFLFRKHVFVINEFYFVLVIFPIDDRKFIRYFTTIRCI